jgi:hypothetical protein
MSILRSTAALALAVLLPLTAAGAQGAGGAPRAAGDTARDDVLRVFLDCDAYGCRRDYFITEIAFVSWMRDRKDADVHLLVTTLGTGSGGRQYTVTLLGQRRFAGWTDTLVVSTLPNESEDQVRQRLARAFKAGLVRYAVRTTAGERLTIGYTAPAAGAPVTTRLHDRWNFWTFAPSVNGFVNGQSRQTFVNAWANFSADRITEAWKVNLNVDGNFNRSRFTFEGDSGEETSVFTRRGYSTSGRVARSVGGHWSVGLSGWVGRSDFRNQSLAVRVGPSLEWNLFPWAEATRRQLTFAYSVRGQHYSYQERTIFDRLRETRASHLAVVALDSRQRWGTVEWSARAAQYMHDPDLTNLSTGVELELRLVRGLSLELDGDIARVRDQLYLSGVGLTRDDVLLQQRALATNYEYFTRVGLSYTFGSIYNTVVNPRLNAIENAQ